MKWLYLNKVPEHYDLETMNTQDLLEAIGDDIHILSYSIEKWKKNWKKITPQKVYDVLCQLQLETHYLAVKFWQIGMSTTQQLQGTLPKRRELPRPLFAVFESSVQEEDKYISVPLSQYYATEWEATSKKSLLISEEQFEEHQLQILSL